MSISILRWQGGSGGDMIMYFKSLSCPGSVVNVKFSCIDGRGKTNVDFSKFKTTPPTDIEKIALNPHWLDQVNLEQLSAEIYKYQTSTNTVWAKSHYYNSDQFNDITVDLIVDPTSLPFVVFSNIVKTDTVDVTFNELSALISDPVIKTNYSIYSVASDLVNTQKNFSKQKILVSDLLCGLDVFKTATDGVNLQLDFNFSDVYQGWIDNNQPYIPSKQYQTKISNQNYDFMDTTLNLFERYSLMALAGSKFINLENK